jgi:CobQ-like glutamine amidotransferase family enzyme
MTGSTMPRRRKRKQPLTQTLIVNAGAVMLLGIGGHQCYQGKLSEASGTVVLGLGLMGIGTAQSAAHGKLDEILGHTLDIRNNPANGGTSTTPPAS